MEAHCKVFIPGKKKFLWGRSTLIDKMKTWRICAVLLSADFFCTKGSYFRKCYITEIQIYFIWHLTDSILPQPKFKLKHWCQGCCWNWHFIWKKKYPCLKMAHPCTLVNSPYDVHGVWLDVQRKDERGRSDTEEMFLQGDGRTQLYLRRESWHVFILSFQTVSQFFQQSNHAFLSEVRSLVEALKFWILINLSGQIPVTLHNSILGKMLCRNQYVVLSILCLCFFHTISRIRCA